jgi:hypothetical protein
MAAAVAADVAVAAIAPVADAAGQGAAAAARRSPQPCHLVLHEDVGEAHQLRARRPVPWILDAHKCVVHPRRHSFVTA